MTATTVPPARARRPRRPHRVGIQAVRSYHRLDVTPEQLRDFVREQVAAYKYPREVGLVPELPKGPTGKILKREIKVAG